MEVSKDMIKVNSGQKTLLCTEMKIRLDNGKVYQGSAAEIYKMLERSGTFPFTLIHFLNSRTSKL